MRNLAMLAAAALMIGAPLISIVPSSALAATGTCASGMSSMITASTGLDISSISGATTANIQLVSDCSSSDVSAALALKGGTAVRTAIEGNSILVAQLQAQGFTTASVLGASVTGDALTLYVTAVK